MRASMAGLQNSAALRLSAEWGRKAAQLNRRSRKLDAAG
jgi:hypothetical protein